MERGQHVMFDCHGTLDLYCWDGGKTWVVGGEPQGEGKRNLRATAQVAEELVSDMKPGTRPSVLQAKGRELYRKAGVADAEAAVIFFHGLGLSHWEHRRTATADWRFEAGMVVPLARGAARRRNEPRLAGGSRAHHRSRAASRSSAGDTSRCTVKARARARDASKQCSASRFHGPLIRLRVFRMAQSVQFLVAKSLTTGSTHETTFIR